MAEQVMASGSNHESCSRGNKDHDPNYGRDADAKIGKSMRTQTRWSQC